MASKVVQHRGGNTPQHSTFTGAQREITVDTTKKTLVVHDGVTPGGTPLAKESDLNNTISTVNTINTNLSNKLDKSGGALTGPVTGLTENYITISGSNVDLNLGNAFKKTITGTTAFTVSNVPPAGRLASFVLEVVNGGNYVIGWFNGIQWSGGALQPLTVNGKDILTFYTVDGGITWIGSAFAKDVK